MWLEFDEHVRGIQDSNESVIQDAMEPGVSGCRHSTSASHSGKDQRGPEEVKLS